MAQNLQKLLKWGGGLLAIVILLFIFAPIAIVPAGHRGVMTTFGNPSGEIYGEGIHFRIPIAQRMNLVDVNILKGEGDGEAASKRWCIQKLP